MPVQNFRILTDCEHQFFNQGFAAGIITYAKIRIAFGSIFDRKNQKIIPQIRKIVQYGNFEFSLNVQFLLIRAVFIRPQLIFDRAAAVLFYHFENDFFSVHIIRKRVNDDMSGQIIHISLFKNRKPTRGRNADNFGTVISEASLEDTVSESGYVGVNLF